jgi:hypothetical protein
VLALSFVELPDPDHHHAPRITTTTRTPARIMRNTNPTTFFRTMKSSSAAMIPPIEESVKVVFIKAEYRIQNPESRRKENLLTRFSALFFWLLDSDS